MAKGKILTAVDIGSYEVKVAIGIPQTDDATEERVQIIGLGCCPSKGIKSGVVINIEDTLKSIAQAISDAEEMAGVKAENIYSSISGVHIKGFSSNGVVAVNGSEIDKKDIQNVVGACKAVKIDTDRELLHTLPQEYIVDGMNGIREPIGITGVRLEAKVYIVTSGAACSKNVVKCINQNGYHVEDLIVSGVASSYSVLKEDEKELGVMLLDIGAGTTDIVVYKDGAIQYLDVLDVAGNSITSELAVDLRAPISIAETIKKSYSIGASSFSKKNIDVSLIGGIGKAEVSTKHVADIVEGRVKEILKYARSSVEKSCRFPISSVVLCGGTANLRGIDAFASDIFEVPIRVAQISETSGLADLVKYPQYATITGLLKLANLNSSFSLQGPQNIEGPMKIFKKFANWFCENF